LALPTTYRELSAIAAAAERPASSEPRAVSGLAGACSSGAASTTGEPWIMFMPHANPNSPASAGSILMAVR
jgi:hypothetical protein